MNAPRIPLKDLAAGLADRAESLGRGLVPGGAMQGRKMYRAGGVSGGKGSSFALHVAGPKAGRWRDYATGEHGDLLELVRVSLGCDIATAAAWARAELGITDQGFTEQEKAEWAAAQRLRREQAEAKARELSAEDDRRRAASAREIWSEAVAIEGTPAQAYLRGRGVSGALPPSLRFHSRLWHPGARLFLPGMIGLIQGAPAEPGGKGEFMGIHRTFLDSAKAAKADVSPAKMMLGKAIGGAVRLSRAAPRLILCEGIETGLSLLRADVCAVWCALSVGGLVHAWVPDEVTELVLAVDGDGAGDRVGGQAWRQARVDAVKKHARPGRRVFVRDPGQGFDWNDLEAV